VPPPPKSRVTLLALSYVIATALRAGGPDIAARVHRVPFQVQVSVHPPEHEPPNKTANMLVLSYAIPTPRPGCAALHGEALQSCVQDEPPQAQVRAPELMTATRLAVS
jgi:hypothetical protein